MGLQAGGIAEITVYSSFKKLKQALKIRLSENNLQILIIFFTVTFEITVIYLFPNFCLKQPLSIRWLALN